MHLYYQPFAKFKFNTSDLFLDFVDQIQYLRFVSNFIFQVQVFQIFVWFEGIFEILHLSFPFFKKVYFKFFFFLSQFEIENAIFKICLKLHILNLVLGFYHLSNSIFQICFKQGQLLLTEVILSQCSQLLEWWSLIDDGGDDWEDNMNFTK